MPPLQLSVVQGASIASNPTLNENTLFLSDMQALFRKERHGHVGAWQYSDNEGAHDPVRGAILWEAFLKASKDYYPLHTEIELIRNKAGLLIGKRVNPVWLTDFGPGPPQTVRLKTLPIKKHFQHVVGYSPIDLSETYLHEASQVVFEDQPNISLKAFHADYFTDYIQLPKGNHTPFGLFFGSTISNFEGRPEDGMPTDAIINQLVRLKEILGNGGELMMAYDANQDEQSILSSYMHELQMEFGRNIMHRVVRDLPVYGNFYPDAWRYEPQWHAQTHQLCHTIICEKDMDFWLGDEHFKPKAGESFILNNSFKYPVEKMNEWSQQAGWGTQHHEMDAKNRVALQLMAA